MTVIRCTTSEPSILYAVLWEGPDSLPSLDAISGFQDCPHAIYDGNLYIYSRPGLPFCIAEPGKHYVLRGTTGQFFIVTKEEFESTCTPMGETPRTERNAATVEFAQSLTEKRVAQLKTQLRACREIATGLATIVTAWEDVPDGEYEGGRIILEGDRIKLAIEDGEWWYTTQNIPADWRIQRLVEKDDKHNES